MVYFPLFGVFISSIFEQREHKKKKRGECDPADPDLHLNSDSSLAQSAD